MTLTLSPALDPKALSTAFARTGRLHLPGLLPRAQAERNEVCARTKESSPRTKFRSQDHSSLSHGERVFAGEDIQLPEEKSFLGRIFGGGK